MYDPNPGRFLSEDPLGYEAGDANLYRYVLNSPVNYLDPTGEAPVPVAPPPTPLPTPVPTPTPTLLPTPTPKPPIPGLGVLGGAAIILLWDLLFPRPLNVGEDEFLEQLDCSGAEPPQARKRCEFILETSGNPNSAFKTCAYKCKGYGALATFPWPKDLPCPGSFDGNFPNIPPGYPDPNIPGT